MPTILSRKKTPLKIENKSKNKTRGIKKDAWADWAPVWRQDAKAAAGVHDWQEAKSPTIEMAHPDPACQHKIRRRFMDARLWGDMTEPQQRAAQRIATSYEAMSAGLGRVTSDWTRVPGSGQSAMSDGQSRFLDNYMDWATACAREKLSHAMVLDILCFGKSCRTVDTERRQRKGNARENLMAALSLYARLQGWR